MSYEYIGFRAVDGPVSPDNLEFMGTQSSRAEITPWSFRNDYHYGSFGGDSAEMLRRGYDVMLNYSNYGIQVLQFRLPSGLPEAAAQYLHEGCLEFEPDEDGPGGILCIRPELEPGDFSHYDLDNWMDELVPLRAEILRGDLRPLYLARLCMAVLWSIDRDELEGPVPAGLGQRTAAQQTLTDFFEISDSSLTAAAQASPPLPKAVDQNPDYATWLAKLPSEQKDQWLAQLIQSPNSPVRAEIFKRHREEMPSAAWPTIPGTRTFTEILAVAEEIGNERERKAKERAERERANKLKKMAADPQPLLRKTEELVAKRSPEKHRQAAQILAELREALAANGGGTLAEDQARKLCAENPTLRSLVRELRAVGFLKE